MAAALGCDLVLDVDRRDAGPLIFAHCANEIDGVAVAGVGVGDHRNLNCGHDLRRALDGFRHGDEADVRDAHATGHRAAAEIHRSNPASSTRRAERPSKQPGAISKLLALQ